MPQARRHAVILKTAGGSRFSRAYPILIIYAKKEAEYEEFNG
jgi:hypothetical protein